MQPTVNPYDFSNVTTSILVGLKTAAYDVLLKSPIMHYVFGTVILVTVGLGLYLLGVSLYDTYHIRRGKYRIM